jgi:hypothetical protein
VDTVDDDMTALLEVTEVSASAELVVMPVIAALLPPAVLALASASEVGPVEAAPAAAASEAEYAAASDIDSIVELE